MEVVLVVLYDSLLSKAQTYYQAFREITTLKIKTITIVAKASDGQRYPMPLSKCWFEFEGERGSGLEGVADVLIDGIVCPIDCTALFM